MSAALIVFAKVPQPGHVKTRLVPPLSPEQAAACYEAMLLDALDAYTALGRPVRLYFAPSGAPAPEGFARPGLTFHTQQGDDLGARMRRAFLETFLAGYQQAVIIGTDHPTLPPAFVEMAFEAIEDRGALVLGPSDDGGYYLLGMHGFFPALFDGMQYSHPEVFAQTLSRAAALDAAVTVLPPWYDVDEAADLEKLRHDLNATPEAAPRTRAFLAATRIAGNGAAARAE